MNTNTRTTRVSRAAVLGLACAVALAGGALLRAQSVVLQPGTIQGTVTLGGVTISQLKVDARWTTQTAYASFANTGDYTLTVNVPSGTTPEYTVYPTIYSDANVDYLRLYGLGKPVVVAANATSQLDLTYEPAFVEGTISVSGGTLSQAYVYASATGWNAQTRTTAQQGNTFRFAVMPGASVQVSADVRFPDGTALQVATTLTNLVAGETRAWDPSVTAPSSSVSGILTVDPMRPTYRRSMTASGPVYRTSVAQADGTYAIAGLPNGTYHLFPELLFGPLGRTSLRAPYAQGSGFTPVTLSGSAIVDRHVPLATISGTFAFTGSRTLASVTNAQLYMNGQANSTTAGGQGRTDVARPGGDFELVVTPGKWLLNSYNYFTFVEASPYLNSTLQIYDTARQATPVTVAAGENATYNVNYATGSVTIMFRTTSGTFSGPRLQGSCEELSGTQRLTQSQIYASGNQQNVTEAPVTFIGIKGRCTLNAYGRPAGSNGETSFGQVVVDVVPGSDQAVDLGGPTLSVLTPGANTAFSTATTTVTGTVTDDQEVTSVTVNGTTTTLTSTGNASDPREMSFSAPITLVAGANVIKTVATDAAGKITSDTRTVYLDAEKPALTLTLADGTLSPGTTTVAGTATDNLGISTISINGAIIYATSGTPQTSVSFTKAVTLVDGGTLEVVITDLGGLSITETRDVASTPADTTAPVITVPSNMTAEATSAAGAVVTYAAAATDETDGATAVSCSPASGATFPVGTTTVTCSSTDAAGNTGTSTFTVKVQDTTAPVLTVPASMTLTATSATGAPATFSATATDAVSGNVPVVCSRASGSEFAVGTTTVTCTATDPAGNTVSGSFTVTVSYAVCLLYETDKLHKSGSTVPVKLQICTAAGQNLSSPSLVVNARQVVRVSTAASGEVEDAGQANPDNDFRYDATLRGYIFNLQTKGLAQGTYNLIFTINGAAAASPAPFMIR